jgi:tRNA(fMet)-specific endonuclease VapC
MVIADTDLIVGFLRNSEEARKKMQALKTRGEPVHITVFTLFELLRGAYLSTKIDENVARIYDFLQYVSIINFERYAAGIAAKYDAMLIKKGTPIGTADTFIAAICISENQKIITRNGKHFKRMPSIKIEEW